MPEGSRILVAAHAGEPFAVSAPQHGTSGYQWLVEQLPPGVRLLGERTAEPEGDAPPGTPAERQFRFTAERAGHFTIMLASKRAWEAEPAERLTVAVTVT